MITHEQIGHAVAELRKRRDVSQAELAEALGVGQATISEIENGQRRLSIVELLVILRRLNCKLGSFFRSIDSA